jgi:hypothetical protein
MAQPRRGCAQSFVVPRLARFARKPGLNDSTPAALQTESVLIRPAESRA